MSIMILCHSIMYIFALSTFLNCNGNMNFVDFGKERANCYLMKEGFLLWEINGDRIGSPVLLEEDGSNVIVHVLVQEGEIKLKSGGRPYLLTKDCFANFIDHPFLEILEISRNAKAYVLFFTSSFMLSLLKDTPPFPPSYVLKIRMYPVTFLSSTVMGLFLKRMDTIVGIFADDTHHFQMEMMKCALWMFMMDMANEYTRQENESSGRAEKSRGNILFKQFMKLLLTYIREGHSVSWYASKLCVTPQYLNRVVKSSSQKTAYDHICTILTGAIIQQLESTDNPISQIAEDFHFPDQATLTKFFKRQTGKTPTEYRKIPTLL